MSRRAWTPAETAALGIAYGLEPVGVIAASLQRTVKAVHAQAHFLGLTVAHRNQSALRTEIRRRSRAGATDTEISSALGYARSQVSRLRRRMGLPVSAGVRRRQRDGVRVQHERLGISLGGDLRRLAYERFASDSGWPADLKPREVQILNALAARGVPMTRLELATAIGTRTDLIHVSRPGQFTAKLLSGRVPGHSYTASLLRRGLLTLLPRAATVLGCGKGRSRHLYCLSPLTLSLLEARCPTHAGSP